MSKKRKRTEKEGKHTSSPSLSPDPRAAFVCLTRLGNKLSMLSAASFILRLLGPSSFLAPSLRDCERFFAFYNIKIADK
jgi:hypothetical protein